MTLLTWKCPKCQREQRAVTATGDSLGKVGIMCERDNTFITPQRDEVGPVLWLKTDIRKRPTGATLSLSAENS